MSIQDELRLAATRLQEIEIAIPPLGVEVGREVNAAKHRRNRRVGFGIAGLAAVIGVGAGAPTLFAGGSDRKAVTFNKVSGTLPGDDVLAVNAAPATESADGRFASDATVPDGSLKLATPSTAAAASDTDQPDTTIGEKLIRTGELQLGVKDLAGSVAAARAKVVSVGGMVAQEQVNADPADAHFGSATAVYRVPPEQFDHELAELSAIGQVTGRTANTSSVTAEFTDIEGRLKTAKVSSDRLRDLLAKAADTKVILELEQALTQRESEIESMEGRLRVIGDQVGRSTITVTFSSPRPAQKVSVPAPKPSKHIPGFVRGLQTGWAAFVNVLNATATAIGATLPFAAPMALTGMSVWWMRRRRRTRPLRT